MTMDMVSMVIMYTTKESPSSISTREFYISYSYEGTTFVIQKCIDTDHKTFLNVEEQLLSKRLLKGARIFFSIK